MIISGEDYRLKQFSKMETQTMQWFRVLKDSKQMVISKHVDMKLMKIPFQRNLGENGIY